MNILGLNIKEHCSAAVMKDGKVLAACAEERFVREKGYGGFPAQSVGYCLKEAGLKAEDIDLVAAGDLGATALGLKFVYVQRRARFSVEDYVREAREYWYPKLYEGKDIDYLEVFKDKLCLDTFPEEFNRYFFGNADKYKKADMFEMQKLKKYLIHSYYPQISEDRIKFYPHHEMHAFYGYYGSRFAEEKDPILIVTADSWGDLSNGTISRFEDGEFEVLHTVDNHNLGRLFRNITLYLGMKPYDHEYKVMGLAPYAPMYLSDAAYKVFSNVLSVDGLDFIYKEKPQDHYFWYKKRLEGIRFDGVAAGLQRHFEECVQKWIRNAIVKYGVKKVCFSGGLAMNIKANMKLGQMDEVEDFSVAASPEDTANSIGACFLAMCRESKKNSGVSKKVNPLDSMYLGPEVTNEEISRAITSNNLEEFCNIQKNIEPEFIAARLAEGIVIGRCAERMEFGARSLGNRSILADPRNPEIVNRINKIIKMRDFWMPFAPVILDTYWEKYLVNKKGLFSPFMMIGFETTSLGRKDMPAAIHSADNTTRPQMLKENVNPDYYRIVSEFEKITGVGALLNTSFNLHGYPIVRTAEDAIDVFLNSHLDALLLNNTYIEKEHENKTDV